MKGGIVFIWEIDLMKKILEASAIAALFTILSGIGMKPASGQSTYYSIPQIDLSNESATLAQQEPESVQTAPGMTTESPYDRYMRLGYAALQTEDYQIARTYFRSALEVRPYDRHATISYWNAIDMLQQQERAAAGDPSPAITSDYDRYMRIGYDATEQRDYNTALINFRRALAERPGDPYASQAVRNVSTYLQAEQVTQQAQ